jgi:hypothetical protein
MNNPASFVHVPIVLAIENGTHRQRMAAVCEEIGFQPEQIGSANLIYHLTHEQFATSLVILDTEPQICLQVQKWPHERSRFNRFRDMRPTLSEIGWKGVRQ